MCYRPDPSQPRSGRTPIPIEAYAGRESVLGIEYDIVVYVNILVSSVVASRQCCID